MRKVSLSNCICCFTLTATIFFRLCFAASLSQQCLAIWVQVRRQLQKPITDGCAIAYAALRLEVKAVEHAAIDASQCLQSLDRRNSVLIKLAEGSVELAAVEGELVIVVRDISRLLLLLFLAIIARLLLILLKLLLQSLPLFVLFDLLFRLTAIFELQVAVVVDIRGTA